MTRLRLAAGWLLLFPFLPSFASPASESEILWAVENRFRLFDYLGQRPGAEHSAALLKRYAAGGSLQEAAALAPYAVLASRGSPFVAAGERRIDPGPWNAAGQQYASDYARDPRPLHRMSFRLKSPVEGVCRWSLRQHGTREIPCRETLVADEVPSDFELSVDIPGRPGAVLKGHVGERRIVAIGDSYGSGEGNPDAPSVWKKDSPFNGKRLARSLSNLEHEALWWDQRCHRSFWSNQMFAALAISLADPHAVVTFLPYSCSGAEIFDGLLMPQTSPPGVAKNLGNLLCDPAAGPRELCQDEMYSQLSAVARDLCEAPEGELGIRTPGNPWTEERGISLRGNVCRDAAKIDTLLVSIGGNDVGFSDVVAWGLMPANTKSHHYLLKSALSLFRRGQTVCPSENAARAQKTFGTCGTPTAERLARNRLPMLYDALAAGLERQLRLPSSARVVVTAYPNPLEDASGRDCEGLPQGTGWRRSDQYSVQAAWDGISYFLNDGFPFLDARSWDFNLTAGEVQEVKAPVIANLNSALFGQAAKHGWIAVDGHLQAYLSHGWCAAGAGESEADFVMPGIPRGGKEGIAPWKWDPYKPRGRWLRTINDALLTQFTRTHEGAKSGSFHPTAEGHYATGQAIVAQWLRGEGETGKTAELATAGDGD